MRLETPEKIRELQRELYRKAKQVLKGECLRMKIIGKPYSGAKLDRRETNRTYGLMRGSWR